MEIKFYTTGCPRCKVLEKKLEQKNLSYEKIIDIELMKSLNIEVLPMLQVDNGELMNFSTANKWINELEV